MRAEGVELNAEPDVVLTEVRHAFGPLAVLDGLSLSIARGEVVGLVGPSGCGKSTLLELTGGLASPSAGSILVGGDGGAGERLGRCTYMPQRDLLLPWLSALDNAAIGLRFEGAGKASARERALPLLRRAGLEGFEEARPRELSGGMRQRVGFLRALLPGKPVLLLDEPFASLDAITRGEMQEWLAELLAAESRTVLLVTHDVEEALYLCDRVAILSARPARIVAELTPERPRGHPRTELVTDPEFTALRHLALDALGGSG